ncbi:MAG: hypothetical protein VW405_10680 [Rhodospirillaceae bacterium]
MPLSRLTRALALSAALLAAAPAAVAGEAVVVAAKATPSGGGAYTFAVTIRHADTGWDHYADRFDILDAAGNVLGKRVLFHPHVDEQPFTSSSNAVKVPPGTREVFVRADVKVHGDAKTLIQVTLPGGD